MIVKTAKERFVIPLSHVHETVRPTQADLHFATGIGEIFSLRGESLPIYRLNQLLDKKNHDRNPWECVAIVVRLQGQPFAVLVDEIVGQAQVVIKKLGDEHAHLRGFSGSAILGDGRPALILELPELSLRAKPNNSMKEPRRVA
jgi:two-component system chemotaxis sensor kinase CheA